jgi:hypothetical protein
VVIARRQGYEIGSTIQKTPPVAQLVAMARARLLPVPVPALGGTVHHKTDDGARGPMQTLKINEGKRFDGIGAISGSTTSALFDYSPPQRERLLDLLFTPRLGAAVQVLKVEIPGDGDSTVSSEPSHMHTEDDLSYERGVE